MRRARIHPQACRCHACTGARSTGLGTVRTVTAASAARLAGATICAVLIALLVL